MERTCLAAMLIERLKYSSSVSINNPAMGAKAKPKNWAMPKKLVQRETNSQSEPGMRLSQALALETKKTWRRLHAMNQMLKLMNNIITGG